MNIFHITSRGLAKWSHTTWYSSFVGAHHFSQFPFNVKTEITTKRLFSKWNPPHAKTNRYMATNALPCGGFRAGPLSILIFKSWQVCDWENGQSCYDLWIQCGFFGVPASVLLMAVPISMWTITRHNHSLKQSLWWLLRSRWLRLCHSYNDKHRCNWRPVVGWCFVSKSVKVPLSE